MDLLTALLVGVPAQLAVFLMVPLAWWLQSARPDGALHRYLGLRRVDGAGDPRVIAATVTAGLGFLGSALLTGPAWWASASTNSGQGPGRPGARKSLRQAPREGGGLGHHGPRRAYHPYAAAEGGQRA